MRLIINNHYYTIPSNSTISSKKNDVIIEGKASITLCFDKERSARYFANIIRNVLESKEGDLQINKLPQCTEEFPFGYSYKYMYRPPPNHNIEHL